ncbi:MAG: lipid-A-disaccharide synthase [Timaviella obliquedivisa GSE-PSE-MK23-08B]|jgi:lipid-A-disaccharide synthase|nr:lipid-A-disaccharide synthase [Timaviella obliquedivisa GSE-PSE-MK23-08B]
MTIRQTEGQRARNLNIFISTGEVSGDLQGALLIESLYRQALSQGVTLEITGLGGDRMSQAGATLLADTTTISSIGILESIPHIFSTLQLQRRAKRHLQIHPPDIVILIDYFGPNLGIGGFIRKFLPHVPTVYYIAPQEWVWSFSDRNTQRILSLSDRLLAIFKGEAEYYQKKGGNVTWVGHPLVDGMVTAPTRLEARQALGIASDQLAIALIPASRLQEIKYVLPIIFAAAQQIQAKLPHVHFWIPLSLETYRAPLEQAIQQYRLQATLISKQSHSSQTVIAAADLAIAKSGTVNLETALLNVPQVITYRLNAVTAWIAEHILKLAIPFASPPNLVLMEEIVPELLQANATPDRIAQEALEILSSPERRATMLAGYQRMRQELGAVGVCDRAAHEILGMVKRNGDR